MFFSLSLSLFVPFIRRKKRKCLNFYCCRFYFVANQQKQQQQQNAYKVFLVPKNQETGTYTYTYVCTLGEKKRLRDAHIHAQYTNN